MLYKILYPGGASYPLLKLESKDEPKETHIWALPTGDQPGAWSPKAHLPLKAGKRGYILVPPKELTSYLGPLICTTEHRGTIIRHGQLYVCEEVRLLRQCPWSWTRGATWMSRMLEIILHHHIKGNAGLIRDALAVHYEYLTNQPPKMSAGDLHDPNDYDNFEVAQSIMLNQVVHDLRNNGLKFLAEAYTNGSRAARCFLRGYGDFVEGALVAFGKCHQDARTRFMNELFGQQATEADDTVAQ